MDDKSIKFRNNLRQSKPVFTGKIIGFKYCSSFRIQPSVLLGITAILMVLTDDAGGRVFELSD